MLRRIAHIASQVINRYHCRHNSSIYEEKTKSSISHPSKIVDHLDELIRIWEPTAVRKHSFF